GDWGFGLIYWGEPVPESIQLYGYNLSTVTGAWVRTGLGFAQPAAGISAGLPPFASWSPPAGMEVIGVELPESLALTCETTILEITVETDTEGGTLVEGNPVEVAISSVGVPWVVPDVPAVITGAIVPAGIRRGAVEIRYNLLMEPAYARWDVIPEFLDPIGGEWLPCSHVFTTRSGRALLPGVSGHPSRLAGIRGPGSTQRFLWDSEADLPAALGHVATPLRLRPRDPEPAAPIPCDPGRWTTPVVVIDNSAPAAGEIVEAFEDNLFEDPAGTNALWNAGADGLLAGDSAAMEDPAWGGGTEDLVLFAGGSYLIETDTGSVTDLSGPGPPLLLLAGDGLGELHLRSFILEAGALVEIRGARPLVVRCSGDGDPDTVAARIAGEMHLDGEDGTKGTEAGNGIGGAGGPGGGDGGDGGLVERGSYPPGLAGIARVVPATAGGGGGGEGGQSISYALLDPSLPRAGAGGGGGHALPGGDGIMTFDPLSIPQAEPGRGGAARGDTLATTLSGGSGGGGGGGSAYRLGTSFPVAVRHGGGGGGGGGAVEIVGRGRVEVTGTITVNGGNGELGTEGSSPAAGGGGSGGAIVVRATGAIDIAPGTELKALGGQGGVTQATGGGTLIVFGGGDGAPGRILLLAGGEVTLPDPAELDADPAPILGPFLGAEGFLSRALSLPYLVTAEGGIVRGVASVFEPPQILLGGAPPPGTAVVLLLEGASARADGSGRPGPFHGRVDDPALLEGAEFLRMRWILYGNPSTTSVPAIEEVLLPFDL
ncbi:MAG: hypothetical protein ACE5GW_11790, partial [Planctomycetota bacterium]